MNEPEGEPGAGAPLRPRGQVPRVSGSPRWRSRPSGGGAGAFPEPPAVLSPRTCGSFVLPQPPPPPPGATPPVTLLNRRRGNCQGFLSGLASLGTGWGQTQRVLPRVFLNLQPRREVAGAHFAYEETEAGSSGPCLNHTVTLPETGTGRKRAIQSSPVQPHPNPGNLADLVNQVGGG